MLTRKESIRLVEREYREAFSEVTVQSDIERRESAFKVADQIAVSLTCRNHGLRFITETTSEMFKLIRSEATSLRKLAIGM